MLVVTNSCLIGLMPWNSSEIIPGMGNVTSFLGPMKSWTLEENLLMALC